MPRILYDLCGANDLRFSPNCWRSRLALAHKELEATFEPVRFTGKEVLAFSGQKLVPVLKDGETVVCESWPIAEYLEDTYPDRPSLFGGPEGRSATKDISDWADTALHPALVKTILYDIYESIDAADKDYFRATREKRFGMSLEAVAVERETHFGAFRETLGPLNAVLGGQEWFAGEAPAYGDYLIFGAFQWARAVSPLQLLHPDEPLHEWRGRMLDLFDGLGRTVPERTA